MPIAQIARDIAGTEKAKNNVVLGLMAGWFGFAPEGLLQGIRKRLGKKGGDVLEKNEKAFAAGQEYAETHPLASARRLEGVPPPSAPKLLTDGNEMCGAAAIFAGCTFFSGYPITPSTEIMHYLGREIWKYGGVVLQAEDEIAGVGAVVGASFAGKKAMTATSGPGMSLKTEMLGLATIAELPLVCVNVQRGGPSTGIPTKSEQSDLLQARLLVARRRGAPDPRADDRRGHVPDDRRGVQHRGAIPDAGHHPVGRRHRAAQGDRRSDRHGVLQDRRTGASPRARSSNSTSASRSPTPA